MSDNPRKVKYALGLLSSLEELHDENFVCDFTIKVGDVSFPVHRTILAAASKYFKAMLGSGMIEVKQGYITMKGITPTVMKTCIKYIYTGDAELTPELVGSILEAAHLMQLNGLVEDCFNFLRDNMSDKSCVSTIALSRLYSRQDVVDLAERYLLENFSMVSVTQSFTSISKDDLVRYINATEADHKILWQAVAAWVSSKKKNRDQTLVELLKFSKFNELPFDFLFEKVLCEGFIKKSTIAHDYILETMFSQNEAKSSLTVENVFALNQLIQKSTITAKDNAMKIIKKFMLENFEDLISKDEFVHLDEDDILMFLQSPETKCSSKEFKWKAIFKWTKHESKKEAASYDSILGIMFSQKQAKSSLTVDNVFAIRQLIQNSNIANKDKAIKIIQEFMSENFEDLIDKDEFVHLNEDDILMFLQYPETKCSSGEVKWKAILKWTKHERRRKKLFTKFFKLIQLKRFPKEFIRNKIRVEPLVKESTECMDLIVQVVLDQKQEASTSLEATKSLGVAILSPWNGGIVRVFDTGANQFRVLSRIKGTNMEMSPWVKYGMVNCEGDVYILINENIFKLDRDNKWVQLSTMPRIVDAWPEMVSFQGDIFVLAGSSTMTCYHPAKNEWNLDSPGCGINPHFCVVASEKHIFSIGGRKDIKPTNEVKKFDPNSRSWSNMPPMLEKRSGASAAMLHGMIIVTGGRGGYNDDLKFLDSAEVYNALTRSWSRFTKMNSIRLTHSMTVVCDKLYVCGNNRTTGGKREEEGTIEVYDEENAKWQTEVTEKFLMGYVPACVYNQK